VHRIAAVEAQPVPIASTTATVVVRVSALPAILLRDEQPGEIVLDQRPHVLPGVALVAVERLGQRRKMLPHQAVRDRTPARGRFTESGLPNDRHCLTPRGGPPGESSTGHAAAKVFPRPLAEAPEAAKAAATGLLIFEDPLIYSIRGRIADHSARVRLPAIFVYKDSAEAGGLLAYGPDRRPHPGGAADQVRARHQPQDRQGAWSRHSAGIVGAGPTRVIE